MKLLLTQCIVDLEVGEILWEDKPVSRLTTREVSLLRYLSTRMGTDVSRDELHVEVWGYGVHTVSRAADDTVRRLRRKIEVDPKEPRHLLTVHGEGYRRGGGFVMAVVLRHVDLMREWSLTKTERTNETPGGVRVDCARDVRGGEVGAELR